MLKFNKFNSRGPGGWIRTCKFWTIEIYTYKYEKSQQNNGQKFRYKQKIISHNRNKGTIKAISKCQYLKTHFFYIFARGRSDFGGLPLFFVGGGGWISGKSYD